MERKASEKKISVGCFVIIFPVDLQFSDGPTKQPDDIKCVTRSIKSRAT